MPDPAPGSDDPDIRFSLRASTAPGDVLSDIEAAMNAGSDKTVLERAKEKLAGMVPSKAKDQMIRHASPA